MASIGLQSLAMEGISLLKEIYSHNLIAISMASIGLFLLQLERMSLLKEIYSHSSMAISMAEQPRSVVHGFPTMLAHEITYRFRSHW
jgi:hypothetical protein